MPRGRGPGGPAGRRKISRVVASRWSGSSVSLKRSVVLQESRPVPPQSPVHPAYRKVNQYYLTERWECHRPTKSARPDAITDGYTGDRKSGVEGKRGSVRVDLGGGRSLQKKKRQK